MILSKYDEPVFNEIKLKQTDKVQTVFVYEKKNSEEKGRYYFFYSTFGAGNVNEYENSAEYKRVKILTLAPDKELVKQRKEEEGKEKRKTEIIDNLRKIDEQSARPLRAVVAETATDFDRKKLAELEKESAELRMELAKIAK